METLRLLGDYFPTSVFTGKALIFVSEDWRVELTQHKDRDFASEQGHNPIVRVKIFKKEAAGFAQTHLEDFILPSLGELAAQIEKYVQFAIGRNIRERI